MDLQLASENAEKWGLSAVLMKFDLSRAYARLDVGAIIDGLRYIELDDDIAAAIVEEYAHIRTEMYVPALGHTEVIEFGKGIPEGAPASGLLLASVLRMVLEPAYAEWDKKNLLLRLPHQDRVDDLEKGGSRSITVWVDDIFIMAAGAQQAQQIFQDVIHRLRRVGCEVDLKKFAAVATTCSRHHQIVGPNGELFELSKTLECLGAHIGMLPKEVVEANLHSRIQKGWKAFYGAQRQLINRDISLRARLKLF